MINQRQATGEKGRFLTAALDFTNMTGRHRCRNHNSPQGREIRRDIRTSLEVRQQYSRASERVLAWAPVDYLKIARVEGEETHRVRCYKSGCPKRPEPALGAKSTAVLASGGIAHNWAK